jgi:polysaccharide export outer membrane protein
MKYIFLLLIILSFLSCNVKKNLVYFQGGDSSKDSTITDQLKLNTSYNLIFKTDDLIYIDVNSADVESLKPFMKEDLTGGNQVPGYINGISAKGGYLIDFNGNINFPLIGQVKIGGLSRSDATQEIQAKLREFINDAIVTLRIQNFKVTILGDVRVPGTYNIPNERLTLVEALGLAGDLNITGVRNNVLVIREESGIKKEFRIDLTKNDIFTSPVYYLNQNDVVYVEPNRAKRNTSIVSSTAGIFISVASLVITTINVITK